MIEAQSIKFESRTDHNAKLLASLQRFSHKLLYKSKSPSLEIGYLHFDIC